MGHIILDAVDEEIREDTCLLSGGVLRGIGAQLMDRACYIECSG